MNILLFTSNYYFLLKVEFQLPLVVIPMEYGNCLVVIDVANMRYVLV
jgi:hypothetical protein